MRDVYKTTRGIYSGTTSFAIGSGNFWWLIAYLLIFLCWFFKSDSYDLKEFLSIKKKKSTLTRPFSPLSPRGMNLKPLWEGEFTVDSYTCEQMDMLWRPSVNSVHCLTSWEGIGELLLNPLGRSPPGSHVALCRTPWHIYKFNSIIGFKNNFASSKIGWCYMYAL